MKPPKIRWQLALAAMALSLGCNNLTDVSGESASPDVGEGLEDVHGGADVEDVALTDVVGDTEARDMAGSDVRRQDTSSRVDADPVDAPSSDVADDPDTATLFDVADDPSCVPDGCGVCSGNSGEVGEPCGLCGVYVCAPAGIICDSWQHPQLGCPIFYTRLDDVGSTVTPQVGSGVGTISGGEFVSAVVGAGYNAPAGDVSMVIYPQALDRTRPNLDWQAGTIEFWYRPSYDVDDDVDHTLFHATSASQTQWLDVRKAASSNFNEIHANFWSANNELFQVTATRPEFGWSAGDWVHILVSWRSMPERRALIEIDGQRFTLNANANFTFEAPSLDAVFQIGARPDGSSGAAGVIDELKIYDVFYSAN